MYFRRTFLSITISVIIGILFNQGVQAQTPIIYDIAEVREVFCFRYVQEADDTLCVIRYALTDSTNTLSINGAFLQIENSTSTIATTFAPLEDYGLAAFYFEADDPKLPTWEDSSVQVKFKANPFVAPTQPDSTPVSVEWITTGIVGGDFVETVGALTLGLPRILLRMEQDSPSFATEDLTFGVGITPLGKFIVAQAYEPLITIASQAFILENEFAGKDHDPGNVPVSLKLIESTGRASKFTKSLVALGASFGIPFSGTMIIFLSILIILLFVAIHKFKGEKKAAVYFIWMLILAVSYVGGFPFEATVLLAIIPFLIAGGLAIKRFLPTGG